VVVTDVNEYRLDLARKLGATRAVNVAKQSLDDAMKSLGMTEGFDVGLEMSGNGAALKQLFKAMNHGGRVALLGIPPVSWRSTGTRSSSRAWCSRASTAARCSRPGTR
jgi:threonine 3-dehydrogenase